MRERETRVYPMCCTSAHCGKTSDQCPTCTYFPVKKEFAEWVERTGAKVADGIWSPLVYVAEARPNNG